MWFRVSFRRVLGVLVTWWSSRIFSMIFRGYFLTFKNSPSTTKSPAPLRLFGNLLEITWRCPNRFWEKSKVPLFYGPTPSYRCSTPYFRRSLNWRRGPDRLQKESGNLRSLLRRNHQSRRLWGLGGHGHPSRTENQIRNGHCHWKGNAFKTFWWIVSSAINFCTKGEIGRTLTASH